VLPVNLLSGTASVMYNDRRLYCRETDFEKEWDRVPLGRIQWKSEEEAKVSKLFVCNHFSNPLQGFVLSSQMKRSIIGQKRNARIKRWIIWVLGLGCCQCAPHLSNPSPAGGRALFFLVRFAHRLAGIKCNKEQKRHKRPHITLTSSPKLC